MKAHNELLADFVGKRLSTPSEGFEQQWEFPFCDGYYPTLKTMKFDTSRDWVMAVVYKISELWVPAEEDGFQKSINLRIHNISKIQLTSHIQQVKKELVTFLKWYNDQKKVVLNRQYQNIWNH